MATQPDDIDVSHLVRIGLIGTLLTIAISYAVTGLDYFQDDYIVEQRRAASHVVETVSAPSAEAAADTEVARQTVLQRYAR